MKEVRGESLEGVVSTEDREANVEWCQPSFPLPGDEQCRRHGCSPCLCFCLCHCHHGPPAFVRRPIGLLWFPRCMHARGRGGSSNSPANNRPPAPRRKCGVFRPGPTLRCFTRGGHKGKKGLCRSHCLGPSIWKGWTLEHSRCRKLYSAPHNQHGAHRCGVFGRSEAFQLLLPVTLSLALSVAHGSTILSSRGPMLDFCHVPDDTTHAQCAGRLTASRHAHTKEGYSIHLIAKVDDCECLQFPRGA